MTKFIVTTNIEEIEFDSAFNAATYIYRTMSYADQVRPEGIFEGAAEFEEAFNNMCDANGSIVDLAEYPTLRNDAMKIFETHQRKVYESAVNHIITLLNTTLSFGEPEEQCRMDFY